uniref:Nudix hydrolase domain-containing protein n=1 Tax=Lepeophtheirus salmonis TaxID=72036 RepID=A0A0K2V236_LEPSM
MSNLTNCKMSKLFLGRSLSSGVLQTKLCENIIFSKQGIDTFREAVSSKSLPKFRKVNKLEKGITNYSVLVPFVSPNGKEEELHLLYTKRAAFLRSHSREICFPGGKVEENETLEIAALRETREELSIPEESVQIIASLQPVPTRKGVKYVNVNLIKALQDML